MSLPARLPVDGDTELKAFLTTRPIYYSQQEPFGVEQSQHQEHAMILTGVLTLGLLQQALNCSSTTT